MRPPKFSQILFRGLKYTIFLFGLLHLTLVIFAALEDRNLQYVNPADFLGINILFPRIRDNRAVVELGWVALIGIYSLISVILAQNEVVGQLLKANRKRLVQLKSRSSSNKDADNEAG